MTFQVLEPEAAEASPFFLIADHASALLPRDLRKASRLSLADQARHIGVDIGVSEVVRQMSVLLPAKAILAGYSRLIVDLNRAEDRDDLVRPIYDGTVIDFNQNLSPTEREKRLELYYRPYHARLSQEIGDLHHRHGAEALVALIHSFTPALKEPASSPSDRPWHIGVVWNRDFETAERLLRWLRTNTDMVIGDNEPYSARDGVCYTMQAHMVPLNMSHVMIEIRQDLISDTAGQIAIAEMLSSALRDLRLVCEDEDNHKITVRQTA